MTFNIKLQASWANQVPLRLPPLDTSPVPSSGSGLLKCNRDFQPLFYSPGMQLSTPSALPLQTPTPYLEAYALFVSPIPLTKLFQVISTWHLFSRPSSSHPAHLLLWEAPLFLPPRILGIIFVSFGKRSHVELQLYMTGREVTFPPKWHVLLVNTS